MNINNPTTFGTPSLTLSTSNSSGTGGALRSDDTILVYDTTVPDAITYGQSGAVGSATTSSRRDHAHAMAAEPTPAGWSRQAGSTTIANTSSTSAATLVAFTSLSFADNAPIQIIVSCRKTNDAAVDAGVGLTVNSTAVWAAVVGAGIWHSSTNNETSEGIANVYLHQPADSEPESPLATFSAYTTAGTLRVATFSSNLTNAVPTASITGLTITGIVGDAAITCRIKSVQVYEGTVS